MGSHDYSGSIIIPSKPHVIKKIVNKSNTLIRVMHLIELIHSNNSHMYSIVNVNSQVYQRNVLEHPAIEIRRAAPPLYTRNDVTKSNQSPQSSVVLVINKSVWRRNVQIK